MNKIKATPLKWVISVFISGTAILYSQETLKNNMNMFKVHGTIKGDITDNFAYLYYNNVEDSVKIVDHNFEFKGVVNDTATAQIYIKSAENAPQFYLENSNIEVQISVNKALKDGKSVETMHIDQIKGSRSSQIQKEYLDFYQLNSGKKDFNSMLYSKLTVFSKKHGSHPLAGQY